MNKLEVIVHGALDEHPKLKNIVRDIYQLFFSIIPASNYSTRNITVREGYFYGFHDKRPWSKDDKYLLTHKLKHKSLDENCLDKPIEIGYFSGDNYEKFETLGITRSWNYQQGSMLQWLGDTEDIIFNDYNGSFNIAKVIDINGHQKKELSVPIAAVSSDGKKALSYSFERLQVGMPGYEYLFGNKIDKQENTPNSDGLLLLDLETDAVESIFSIKEIVNFKYLPEFEKAYHFFTHCLFSPSGNRFVFFHRWIRTDNVSFTRMISCDIDGDNMYVFPTNKMVSHMTWYDDDHVIAYANTFKYGCNYYCFSDKEDGFTLMNPSYFTSDGHPQVSPNKHWMVTDTYPNRSRKQSIIIYDFKEKLARKIVDLKIPRQYRNELRCDFHPRWNNHSNMISFDSAQTGYRAHCTTLLG